VRARVLLAAGALFRDEAGRVLLVEPGYKDTWEIPGGVVDEGESPFKACAREITEELALDRAPGRLWVIDHCRRPYVHWEGLRFIFAGGVLAAEEIATIRLPADELRSFRFVDRGELQTLTAQPLARRVITALDAPPGKTVYLENGEQVGRLPFVAEQPSAPPGVISGPVAKQEPDEG